ncbi:hypothetical protein [Dactylosporangium salmoneum]|uniref:Uncharacterized protein n=1 Tax=Dactylosporangium salmoneum TaxID=53361 RepID=A0ABP5TB95_9ACTN
MSEPMTVYPEVWPVAADAKGLWLISGDGPWRPALPIYADGDVHQEVELELSSNGIDRADVVLLHSTSWRADGPAIVLTYIAIVRKPGYVRQNWPGAEPISPLLPAAVGKPPTHAADEAPAPRYVDCLLHAIRHVAFLRDRDATAAAVLDEHWLSALSGLDPALAGMYADQHCRRAA